MKNLLTASEEEIVRMSLELPSQGEVLRFLNYVHLVKQRPIRQSAKMAVRKCAEIWKKFGIPTGDQLQAVSYLEYLYKEWCHYRDHPDAAAAVDPELLARRLGLLFDIAARNALDSICDSDARRYFCYRLDVDRMIQLKYCC